MSSLPLTKVFKNTLHGYVEPSIEEESRIEILKDTPIEYNSPVETYVGIEYEIEAMTPSRGKVPSTERLTQVITKLWAVVDDGSLRNRGKEWVSIPISRKNVALAVSSLGSYIDKEYSRADPSTRCGIHVHINALDVSCTQLFGWISLYRIFEKLLYRFSGDRDKNLFCLPTYAWDTQILSALQVLKEDEVKAILRLSSSHKYAGMNTRSLSEKGTLEFRQMQTVREYGKIALWVEYLTRIKGSGIESCQDYDSLLKYLESLATLNTSSEYSNLLVKVFGEKAVILQAGDWRRDMADGVIMVKEQLATLKKYAVIKAPSTNSFWGIDAVPDRGNRLVLARGPAGGLRNPNAANPLFQPRDVPQRNFNLEPPRPPGNVLNPTPQREDLMQRLFNQINP